VCASDEYGPLLPLADTEPLLEALLSIYATVPGAADSGLTSLCGNTFVAASWRLLGDCAGCRLWWWDVAAVRPALAPVQ